ncbi:MAG: hypothetical protein ACR2LX_04850 [Jatrophihabitans sp.]
MALVSATVLVAAGTALVPPVAATPAPSHGYRASDTPTARDEHPAAGRERPGQHHRRSQVRTTKDRPKASDDQLGKYANLLYGYPSLMDSRLGDHYLERVVRRAPGRHHPHGTTQQRRRDLPRHSRGVPTLLLGMLLVIGLSGVGIARCRRLGERKA